MTLSVETKVATLLLVPFYLIEFGILTVLVLMGCNIIDDNIKFAMLTESILFLFGIVIGTIIAFLKSEIKQKLFFKTN